MKTEDREQPGTSPDVERTVARENSAMNSGMEMAIEEAGNPSSRDPGPPRLVERATLVCLTGLSPAVLTETVWALGQEEPPTVPDRVIVYTTSEGKARLEAELLASGRWEELTRALEADLWDRGWAWEDGGIRFGAAGDAIRVFPNFTRTRDLEDLRTREDHVAVGETLFEGLRGLAENRELRIIASLAGGRKTMGALLYAAMGLIGRRGDRVTHVLVEAPWESLPGFYFPGCGGPFTDPATGERLSSRSARLTLLDVPFVPLRLIFGEDFMSKRGSFFRLADDALEEAETWSEGMDVWVDPGRGTVGVEGCRVELSDLEFAFFLVFARRCRDRWPALRSYLDLEPELLSLSREYDRPEDFGHWTARLKEYTFDKEDPRRWASGIRLKMRAAGLTPAQVQRLVPQRGRLSMDLPASNIQIGNPGNQL